MVTTALIAYTSDGVLRGALELGERRLADVLAAGGTLVVSQAALQAHDDGVVHRLGRAEVDPARLPVIVATGPGAWPDLRMQMTEIPVSATVDRYRVFGVVHVPAGSDLSAVDRATRILFTRAVITYQAGGAHTVQTHEAVLVSRPAIRTLGRSPERDDPPGAGG